MNMDIDIPDFMKEAARPSERIVNVPSERQAVFTPDRERSRVDKRRITMGGVALGLVVGVALGIGGTKAIEYGTTPTSSVKEVFTIPSGGGMIAGAEQAETDLGLSTDQLPSHADLVSAAQKEQGEWEAAQGRQLQPGEVFTLEIDYAPLGKSIEISPGDQTKTK